MSEETENFFEELGKCIGTNANGVSEITNSTRFCELLNSHTESFTREEMRAFWSLFKNNIDNIGREDLENSVICLFNNFPDGFVKEYSYKILDKLKDKSPNGKFLNSVLEQVTCQAIC